MRVLYLVLTLLVSLANVGETQVASLRGTKAAMIAENRMADKEDMTRIEDSRRLRNWRRIGLVVSLPSNAHVQVDSRLASYRRYVRPWTRHLILDLSARHYKRFGVKLQVNSAVRTVDAQKELRKKNPNAAPATGPLASSHLTGATIDITKKGMSRAQRRWMRKELLKLERQGIVLATEEHGQAVFHIMVSRRYSKVRALR